MKKSFIISLSLLLGFVTVNAQQMPMFGTYNYNKMLLNPSVSGMDEKFGANLSSRIQFAGFENAPISNILTADFGPAGRDFGVGLIIYSDNIGLFRTTGVQANYAYRVKLTKELELGLGLGLGYDNGFFDTYSMRPADFNDPVLFQTHQRTNTFRADAGAHIAYKNLFVSFAVPKAYASDYTYNSPNGSDVSITQLTHLMTYASYKIDLDNKKYSITPSVLLRMADNVSTQYDINLGFEWTDKVFAMASYREGYAAALGGGVVINKRTRLGYSYDFAINNVQTYRTGSHEGYISWRLDDKPRTKAIEQIEQDRDL